MRAVFLLGCRHVKFIDMLYSSPNRVSTFEMCVTHLFIITKPLLIQHYLTFKHNLNVLGTVSKLFFAFSLCCAAVKINKGAT